MVELIKRGKNENPISFSFRVVASMVMKERCSKDDGDIGMPLHSNLQW